MLIIVLNISLVVLAVSLALSFVRLAIGPGVPDRILALDTLYINTIAFLVIFGIRIDNVVYFEAALLIAMFGFVGTVTLSKFLLRGDVVE